VPSIAEAAVVHATPGRTRLRVPSRRSDGEYFARVHAVLSEVPGVAAVEVTPETGSILIRHDAPLSAITAQAVERHLFAFRARNGQGAPGVEQMSFSFPFQAAREWPTWPVPGAGLPLATMSAMLLLGLGVSQLFRGQVLPPAITLLWYGANSLLLPLAQETRSAASRTGGGAARRSSARRRDHQHEIADQ